MQGFQQISTSSWLARLDNNVVWPDARTQVEHVALEYGIPAADIRRVDSLTDPRSGTLIMPPLRAPTPDESELSTIRTLYQACIDNTATASQVRQLLGLVARRVFR